MRLIGADALKERIKNKYTFAVASEIGYEIDKMPTLTNSESKISETPYKDGMDGIFMVSRLVTTVTSENENLFIDLVKNEKNEYFVVRGSKDKPDEKIILIPTNLYVLEDYIIEICPEEYDRIKPILDAEREKSAKNKKE